jgi:hypothetical protein
MANLKLKNPSGGSLALVSADGASDLTVTFPAGTGTAVVNGVNSAIVSGTAVATTSGTSIDFTGIPTWVKRITVNFNLVSISNSTTHFLIQIGNTTPTTSGYVSVSTYNTGAAIGVTTSTSGMVLFTGTFTNQIFGSYVLTKISDHIWSGSGTTGDITAANFTITSAGRVSLASALNMVRLTTTNGTDTFDNGSVNILYE